MAVTKAKGALSFRGQSLQDAADLVQLVTAESGNDPDGPGGTRA